MANLRILFIMDAESAFGIRISNPFDIEYRESFDTNYMLLRLIVLLLWQI